MTNYHDGGEAILEAFRNLGVEYIICSPGSEWPPFWEAVARQKRDGTPGPAYLDCGHETIAVTMANAYTTITGRMQAVMLHAGAGLLQGSMAVGAARVMETPMLVMSGESLTFGETDFDPGSQWYRNLSIVGGNQRLLEPVVKWAQQAPAPETLYQSVIRAGELAQRAPKGPTYLCVSMETMLHDWLKPDSLRKVPPAPKVQPTAADIDRVAALIAKAKCPVISVLTAGPDPETFDALVAFAELAALPVIEGAGAYVTNFPKSNELYLGSKIAPLLKEMDLVLLIDSWAPWYPPSNKPKSAQIVSISESPLKGTMVYQTMEANHYLEGNVAITLQLLTEALRKLGLDAKKVSERRSRWQAEHQKWRAGIAAAEAKAADKDVITVPLLMKTLREVMPKETSYVDETIVHVGRHPRTHPDGRSACLLPRSERFGPGVGLCPRREARTPEAVGRDDDRRRKLPVQPGRARPHHFRRVQAANPDHRLQQQEVCDHGAAPQSLLSQGYRHHDEGLLRRAHQQFGVRARRRHRWRLRPAGREACRSQSGY